MHEKAHFRTQDELTADVAAVNQAEGIIPVWETVIMFENVVLKVVCKNLESFIYFKNKNQELKNGS